MKPLRDPLLGVGGCWLPFLAPGKSLRCYANRDCVHEDNANPFPGELRIPNGSRTFVRRAGMRLLPAKRNGIGHGQAGHLTELPLVQGSDWVPEGRDLEVVRTDYFHQSHAARSGGRFLRACSRSSAKAVDSSAESFSSNGQRAASSVQVKAVAGTSASSSVSSARDLPGIFSAPRGRTKPWSRSTSSVS